LLLKFLDKKITECFYIQKLKPKKKKEKKRKKKKPLLADIKLKSQPSLQIAKKSMKSEIEKNAT
jgi:hypothetical protein